MQVVALIDHENDAFGVWFPDFPGCTTVANDADTAVAKAAEVLAFHVEGMVADGLELPSIHTLSQLARDPGFRAASKGALITLVPYAPPARAVRLNITLDESLLERIDRAAAASGETRSGYLAAAAKRRMQSEVSAIEAVVQAGREAFARTGKGASGTTRRRPGKARRKFGVGPRGLKRPHAVKR